MYGNVNHKVDSYGFIGTLWGLTPQWSLVIFGDKSWMVAEAPNIPETHRKHEWSWSPSSMLSIAYGVKVTDPWLHRYDPSQIPQPPSKTQSARSDLANIAQKKRSCSTCFDKPNEWLEVHHVEKNMKTPNIFRHTCVYSSVVTNLQNTLV